MSGLRHAVVEFLGRRALTDERVRSLQALQQREPPKGSEMTHGGVWFARAALLLVAVALPALLWHLLPSQAPHSDMARRIAEEVAANHLHLKPLEIETSTIAGIRGYFSQLDFRPVDSTMMMLDGLELMGGRYCSVQGATAAQLRLRPARGSPSQTLYQAHYDRDRFGPLPQLDGGELPLMLKARGLAVIVWVEQDILFALVRES